MVQHTIPLETAPLPLDHLAIRGREEAPALVLREGVLSYKDLTERVGAMAAWLSARARRGDRIATWAAKGELTCLMPLAAARAGMVHVPINPLLKRAQVAHILADSGAVLLIGTPARLATLDPGDAPCPVLGEGEAGEESWGFAPIGPSDADPEELAAILYTSG